MANYLDMTAGNALLKEYYSEQFVQNMVYSNNPTLAMMPKDENAVGEYIPIPVIYEVSQGASASFTTAQSNQVALQSVKFLLTLKPDYSLTTIQNQAIRASSSDKGSFLRLLTTATNGALRKAKNRAGTFLFRSGTGSIGAIATGGITGGVITLSNPGDVVNFGVGQTLQANATDGGASPRAALGYVVSVSRGLTTSTVTVSTSQGGAATSPGSWTAGDYLLTQGDNNAVMSGLLSWLPSTAPSSSDNFYGVNRSADTRLSGVLYSGTSQTIEECLVDSSTLLAREDGNPGTGIMPHNSYAALEKALGAKREYIDVKGPAGIMFRGITVHGASGDINVFPDRYCPAATGFLLQMDTWKMYSLDGYPGILRDGDNMDMLRVYNADAQEIRAGGYGNIGCNAPGYNANLALSI